MADWDVTTAAERLEFDTQNNFDNVCFQIDSNHFINFWGGLDSDGYVQVFTVNTTTWAVTTANASLEFDTVSGQQNSCCKIDTNHFINFWLGESNDGYAQVFTVNTSTWEATTAADRLEYDAVQGRQPSCYLIDSNHVINFWGGGTFALAYVQVFAIDTSTWAVTTANASLKYSEALGSYNACFQIDSNHFVNFFSSESDDGYVQAFAVNTSTWAVTTANASLEFDTAIATYNSCYKIDSNHFINFWTGSGSDGYVQVFAVNTTTWAVTTVADRLEFDTQNDYMNSCSQVDSNHFVTFFGGEAGVYGYAQVFTVNTSTWEVTTAAEKFQFDTVGSQYNSCYKIDTNHFINFWYGESSDGYVQAFAIALSAAAPTGYPWYSYAQM